MTVRRSNRIIDLIRLGPYLVPSRQYLRLSQLEAVILLWTLAFMISSTDSGN